MRYEVHVGYHKYLIINYQVLNARIWMDDLGIFETSGEPRAKPEMSCVVTSTVAQVSF